jgi:hypothetical protein
VTAQPFSTQCCSYGWAFLIYNDSMLKLGKYRHYKGVLYEVIATALSEAGHHEMVVYKSLEDSGDYPAGTVWVRPLSEFTESVEWGDGAPRARFQRLLAE